MYVFNLVNQYLTRFVLYELEVYTHMYILLDLSLSMYIFKFIKKNTTNPILIV